MNTLKPTQKPVCFSVQEMLQRYKSNTIEDSKYFQSVQTESNRSLEVPESKIMSEPLGSVQDSTQLVVQENDAILQINHMHSMFKCLQKDAFISKASSQSTQNQSQHSQENENKIKPSVSPKQNNSISPYKRIQQVRQKSPNISIRPSIRTPRLNQQKTPSQSPFKSSKENQNTNQKKSSTKQESGKIKKSDDKPKTSYVVVDFTKCPSQRVLIKQDGNRPSMQVEFSLKSLIQKHN